jgi:large conductance mechanosensitive channel
MAKLWQEFKSFAFKGNMIELAMAVVIGTAFNNVVTGLVSHIIMPVLSYVLPAEQSYRSWQLGKIEIGEFVSQVLNFLIIAWAVFLVIKKLLGNMLRTALPPKSNEPATKECPWCLSVIPLKARRCGHCTSDVTVPVP